MSDEEPNFTRDESIAAASGPPSPTSFEGLRSVKFLAAIRRFSPGIPHYLFVGIFFVRLIALERLSRSALLLPARGDMHFYNEWAQRILRGEVDLHHAFYGLPLYPYVLAMLYRL